MFRLPFARMISHSGRTSFTLAPNRQIAAFTCLGLLLALSILPGCGAPETSANRPAPNQADVSDRESQAMTEPIAEAQPIVAPAPVPVDRQFSAKPPALEKSSKRPTFSPAHRPAPPSAFKRNRPDFQTQPQEFSTAAKTTDEETAAARAMPEEFMAEESAWEMPESANAVDDGESDLMPAPTSSAAAVESNEKPTLSEPTTVEVFYATDRNRVAAIVEGDFWKVFGWSIRFVCIALLCGALGIAFRKRSLYLTAATALIAGLVMGYGGQIQWQGRVRMNKNNDVRYTHDIRKFNSDQPDPDMLDYGRCLVNLPPKHQTGIVEAPSLTRFEFTEDREKHVILERVIRSDQSQFFNELNERLAASNHESLIFIHGYNVSFNNAVKRTAQIAWDLKFDGTPVCYSWPSHGGLEDYTRDMANADWSTVHLQNFLSKMFEQSDATKIHLIAHSMGNRVLLQALDRMSLQGLGHAASSAEMASRSTAIPKFGNLVLAAPDVSANDFRQRYSHVIQNMADHVTLYASSRDRALMVSASVHGHERAGLAGAGIVVVDGIDTIDVSHVDSSLIGHSYYGDNPELIDDLKAIIGRSEPTSQRSWLERVDTAANRFYWKFR